MNCAYGCPFDTDITAEHLLCHIKNNIPTKITYEQIPLLPSRKSFCDLALKKAFESAANAGKNIIFMPTSITEDMKWEFGKGTYRVYIFGVLPCGSKTCVVLDDIPVYVDVMVPDKFAENPSAFCSILVGIMMGESVTYKSTELTQQYRLHGHQKSPRPYYRIHFHNLYDRNKALATLRDPSYFSGLKVELASDDSNYFAKVAREYRFATADWNQFSVYSRLSSSMCVGCDFVFSVKVNNYRKLGKESKAKLLANRALGPVIERDPTMIVKWDIETHKTTQDGQVPTVTNWQFTIRTICAGYFWHWCDKPLLAVACNIDDASTVAPCTKSKTTDINVGLITIVCRTETNVLKAHMDVWRRMSPDISSAFNGSHFDWPLYREKLRRGELLVRLKQCMSSLPISTKGKYADTESNVHKYSFRRERVKMDAENMHEMEVVAQFAGTIDTDVLPTFLAQYPRAEVGKAESLNFFLAKNGVELKEDMHWKRMHKIYDRALQIADVKQCHCDKECATCSAHIPAIDFKQITPPGTKYEDIQYGNELHDYLLREDGRPKCCYCGKRVRNLDDVADVTYYCIIDCIRPQQLYVKCTTIAEKRALANMAYVTLYDAFYRAGGMKVRNLIGAYCHKRNIAFSNSSTGKHKREKDHYPGGWVFPPCRGLHSDGKATIEVPDGHGGNTKKEVQCRPMIGNDFNSLYPSLMMTYNLSPDMLVYTREDAEKLTAEGYTLHHIGPFKYERGEKKGASSNEQLIGEGWVVRHRGIHSKKDTHVVERYVKQEIYTAFGLPTVVCEAENGVAPPVDPAYTKKVNYKPIRGRKGLPGEHMGIFGYIVKKLFDKRVVVKGVVAEWTAKARELAAQGLSKSPEHAEAVFKTMRADALQKALKVLANTFYGESGNFLVSIYALLVAAGITCAGQTNIKEIANLARNHGYTVFYGDTDSVYIAGPDADYKECDAQYKSEMAIIEEKHAGVARLAIPNDEPTAAYKHARIEARRRWWEAQIRVAAQAIKQLNEHIIDYLVQDNGTLFMAMGYDGIEYPMGLCGKKKYYTMQHTFDRSGKMISTRTIKGIDIIKQGQAKVAKNIGEEIINEALSVENERDVIDIVEGKIQQYYDTKQDPAVFAKTAKYKLDKDNKAVKRFYDRMVVAYNEHLKTNPALAALYTPPEPGDKFEYVVVQKEQMYTTRGTKINLSVGDRYEYLRVFRASQNTSSPMKIDIEHYMQGALAGIFARFIAHHPKFQPPEGKYNSADPDQYSLLDDHCVSAATKYISLICDKITGVDRKSIAQVGLDNRAVYSKTSRVVGAHITQLYGPSSALLGLTISVESTNKVNALLAEVDAMVATMDKGTPNFGKKIIDSAKARGVTVFRLKRLYNGLGREAGIAKARLLILDRDEQRTTAEMRRLAPHVCDLMINYGDRFVRLIEDMRAAGRINERVNNKVSVDLSQEDVDKVSNMSPADVAALQDMYCLTLRLAAVRSARADTKDIVDAISTECTKIGGGTASPVINARVEARAVASSLPAIDEYSWV